MASQAPLLTQEGSFKRATVNCFTPSGWSLTRDVSKRIPQYNLQATTPSAPFRNGDFFFMARPPLLCKEGNTHGSTPSHRSRFWFNNEQRHYFSGSSVAELLHRPFGTRTAVGRLPLDVDVHTFCKRPDRRTNPGRASGSVAP